MVSTRGAPERWVSAWLCTLLLNTGPGPAGRCDATAGVAAAADAAARLSPGPQLVLLACWLGAALPRRAVGCTGGHSAGLASRATVPVSVGTTCSHHASTSLTLYGCVGLRQHIPEINSVLSWHCLPARLRVVFWVRGPACAHPPAAGDGHGHVPPVEKNALCSASEKKRAVLCQLLPLLMRHPAMHSGDEMGHRVTMDAAVRHVLYTCS